jgi:hypothetical protein
MPRRVQDIIPADRRSIREISVPSRTPARATTRSKKTVDVVEVGEEEVPVIKTSKIPESKIPDKASITGESELSINRIAVPPRRMPVTPPSIDNSRRWKFGKWPIITIVIILAIVLAGYFASAYYSQATFTIVPKVVPVTINSTYVAQGSSQNNGLFYEVITLNGSATTTVASTNGPLTNTKATGKVTLYNYNSTQSVRLIAGTRLSGDSKLLYRLSSSIVIPGYTKSGANIVPGKINANIVADQPGQNYNIPADPSIELKIVAYAGSAKHSTIYSKTISAVSGGFSGVKKNVSAAAMASSTTGLKSEITNSLLEQAKLAIPAGYIMYDKSFVTVFGSPVIGGTASTTATVSLQGTMYAIAFPESKLIEAFAGAQTVALFDSFAYTAPGLKDLNVSITNIKDFSPTKKGALVLSAKGDIKLVGTVPVDEIRKKLAGIPLSSTQEIFKSYSPVIQSGEGELAPPWANIPTDLNKVKIIVEEP